MIDVIERLEKLTESERSIFPCHTNRASSIGDACMRKLVYYRTRWQDQEKPSTSLQRRFNLGKIFEDYAIARLLRAGVRIIRQQEPLSIPEHQITGHPDGNVVDEETGEDYPMDVKSAASSVFYKMNTKEDFARYPWTAKYIAQLMIYMYAQKKDKGMFLFVDKQSGQEKQIWIDYDEAFVQEVFTKADKINEHVAAKTLPERIDYCDECEKSCPFRMICLPDVVYTAPEFIVDEELKAMVERWIELKPIAKECADLEDEIKKERIGPRLTPGVVGEKRKLFIGAIPIGLSWINKKAFEVKATSYWMIKLNDGGAK